LGKDQSNKLQAPISCQHLIDFLEYNPENANQSFAQARSLLIHKFLRLSGGWWLVCHFKNLGQAG